jgi:hypothetical protein
MARWAMALGFGKEVRDETMGWFIFTGVHCAVDGVRGFGAVSLS